MRPVARRDRSERGDLTPAMRNMSGLDCTTDPDACSVVMAQTGEVIVSRSPQRICISRPTPIQPTLTELPPMLAPSR